MGGEIGAASALAPKVGPLGLSPKKIGEDIRDATKNWKGIKVTVQLSVLNRVATITVVSSASAMVLKELNEPVRDRKKEKNVKHNGNLAWAQIRKIAETMRPRSCARTFEGTIREIVGTCQSIGCTVEGKPPKEVFALLRSGELDVSEP